MSIKLCLAGVSGFALLASTPVLAQEAPPADEGDAIVVTGQRAQQERAIEIKREAVGIMDVAAADEIGQLPDRNVAEVIERLPGVGVQYDQGEGRYVAIRGIPSDLNNYTVNGFELGNPDGNTRRLPLDIVSGQLLNRVEVTKAKTADLDAQGIGGTINLVTQTAFDFAEPFVLSANAQAGYQELNEKVPMASSVEIFDTKTLRHTRTVSLGRMYGSLTAMDWHGGSWWAVFANYDDRGGEPGRDHRFTTLVRMDASFRPLESWLFPDAVLERFTPKSCSGFAWGADGLMYASGHDRPEIYALRLPKAGATLELVATLPVPTEGQAIDWDPVEPGLLWSIDRRGKALHSTRIPPVTPAGN